MSAFPCLKRLGAILFIAAYLLLTAYYLGRQVLGDAGGGPFAYFWTWDMFPNYPTESVRRQVVGETASGAFVRLVPNSRQRFRWGVHGDAARFDIDRRLPFIRQAAQTALLDRNETNAADPIQRVYVAESYRPLKYNLPDELYRDYYRDAASGRVYWSAAAAEGKVDRSSYWRILDDAAVEADGSVADWEASP